MMLMLNPELRVLLASTSITEAIRRLLMRGALIPEVRPMAPGPPVIRICGLVANDAAADLARFRRDLDRARALWGPCGIAVAEGAFSGIHAGGDYPDWVNAATAPAELLRQRGMCRPTDIRAYYVRTIAGRRDQSRSGFAPREPGYVAMAGDVTPDRFAQELGNLFVTTPPVDQDPCRTALAAIRSTRFSSDTGLGQPGQAQALQMLMLAAMSMPL